MAKHKVSLYPPSRYPLVDAWARRGWIAAFIAVRNLFGEQQMRSLADYVQAALMLNYNQRNVG